MEYIKIAIIEDDELVLQSLIKYFGQKSDIRLVLHTYSIEEFIKTCKGDRSILPEILLLDIQLPGISGIEGIPLILDIFHNISIVMLTTFEESEKIFASLRAGACSYLSKQSSLENIYQCILTVHSGGSFMSPAIARKVINFFERKVKVDITLTARQREIVDCITEGMSYKMVGAKLDISLDTVRTHIMQIYRALNINSKGELIKWVHDQK